MRTTSDSSYDELIRKIEDIILFECGSWTNNTKDAARNIFSMLCEELGLPQP